MLIELNGRSYIETERGRFDVALVDNGTVIAYTDGDQVVMLSGLRKDVELWAESYDLPIA